MDEAGFPWIELSRNDFLDAIKQIKPGRMLKSFLLRELQIGLVNGEAIFAVEGASTRRPAQGCWNGFACLAYGMLYPYIKVRPDTDPVRLTFENGRLKIGTTRFQARWIEASPWISEMALDAHFFGPITSHQKLYCPRCGKREGMSRGALLDLPVRSPALEDLLNLLEAHDASHGCVLCRYSWAETRLG